MSESYTWGNMVILAQLPHHLCYFVKREHFLKTQESTGRVSEMKTSFNVKTVSWGERQGQNKVLLSDVADNTDAGLYVMPQPGPASCRLT